MKLFDRTTPPHIITLVLATSAGTMATNVFLPSMPGMARYFNADYSIVQLAVPVFLVAMAILQLAIGPASDRFGRRPVIVGCFFVFLAGTLAAIYSPTIEIFLVCRVFQAFGAGGMVISRAVVRDTVGPDEAASRLGYVTMGMAVVPMIAPTIGGFLDEAFGWHSTFWFIFIFGLAITIFVYFDLGETNLNRTTSFAAQMRNYPELLRSRRFWGYTLTAGFTSGAFYAFLGGGPFVATEMLGLSPTLYGIYFACLSVGYMLGNFVSGRYSRRIGLNRMLVMGNVVSCIAVAASILLFWQDYFHPLSLFVPIGFVGLGNGVTLPNANAGIVSVRPHLAGSASGLGGAMQIGCGALLSIVAGTLISIETGPYPLLWVMFFSSAAAVAATSYVVYVARQSGDL